MRIGIFTNNYLPNPYGVTRSIESFRRELEKRGHSVFIFAPRWKDYEDFDEKVFRYPSLDLRIKIRYPLPIPYSRKMDKILENLKLDVIHAQHPNLLGSVAMKWARKLAYRRGRKIPLIFTWHTLYDKYTNFVPFIPARISAGYMIKKAVKFANTSSVVIVPTDSVAPIIKKWGVKNKNIISITTGVSEEEFTNPDRNKIREKYNIKDNEKVLLLVSRLTSEKNVEFIFRSLKDILRKKKIHPVKYFSFTKNNFASQNLLNRVKFLVVGDGYLRYNLEKFCQKENISEKVIFCGEVEGKEMKNYYACSDIFVYASKSETQGMVITEAMYMGLPIVAVSATGINSLVLNRGNGFLVDEKEKEFKEAVVKLVTNKDLREKFSEVSARIAKEKFTASVCGERMLEVYQETRENYS